jgi:hypothetical protein
MEKSVTDTIVDKLLIQAIGINAEKIAEHEKQVAFIRNQILILQKEITEYRAEYKKACPHPEKTVESFYTEGGYDYKSETTYITKCVRCGEKLSSRVERGGYA